MTAAIKNYDDPNYLIEQLETKNYLEIARENKVGKSTIQRKLNAFGLTRKTSDWAPEEIRCLTRNYESAAIHKLFPDRTKSSVYHEANRIGVSKDSWGREYSVNENFFEHRNRESAYFLGWMYSDGNVSKDYKRFGLHLQTGDIEILRKMKRALKSEHKIKTYKNSATFYVHDKKMCRSLAKLGCGPRKTLKIRLPKIPKRFLNHFVRGYFDGDGSIMFNYPNTIKIRFVGYEKFLADLAEKIRKRLRIPTPKITKSNKGNVWSVNYYGDNARKICFWMYSGAGNLVLKRKKKRFEKHMRIRDAK